MAGVYVILDCMSKSMQDLCHKLIALLNDLWASDAANAVDDDVSRKRQKIKNMALKYSYFTSF